METFQAEKDRRSTELNSATAIAHHRSPTLPAGNTPGERGAVSVWSPRPVRWAPGRGGLRASAYLLVFLPQILSAVVTLCVVSELLPYWCLFLALLLLYFPILPCGKAHSLVTYLAVHGLARMRRAMLRPTYISADNVFLSFTTIYTPEAAAWDDITGLWSSRFGGLLLQVREGGPLVIDMSGYAGRDRLRLVDTIVWRAGLEPARPNPDLCARDEAFGIIFDLLVPATPERERGRRTYVQTRRRLANYAKSFARPGVEFRPDQLYLEGIKQEQTRIQHERLDAQAVDHQPRDKNDKDEIPSSENPEKG